MEVWNRFQPLAVRVFDCGVKLLGPALICLACCLISYVSWVGFTIMIPLKAKPFSLWWWIYNIYGVYIVFNILFNYCACVLTNPGNSDSEVYKRLVREAESAGLLKQFDGYWDKAYIYGTDGNDASSCGGDGGSSGGGGGRAYGAGESGEVRSGSGSGSGSALETGLKQRKVVLKPGSPPTKAGGWMELEPGEWGFCMHSRLPKPPRSHYCHVSHRVVMNMDHYCPWMFNTVGSVIYLSRKNSHSARVLHRSRSFSPPPSPRAGSGTTATLSSSSSTRGSASRSLHWSVSVLSSTLCASVSRSKRVQGLRSRL